MDRREAIKTTTMIMGFALTGAALSGTLSGCKADTSPGWKPQSLDKESDEFLIELSEFILPASETPGAKDVYVNRFIDQIITDYFDKEGKERFKTNLNELAEACKDEIGNDFKYLDVKGKSDFVNGQEAKGGSLPFNLWGNQLGQGENLTFYRELKSMILWGYFTSELVGKEVLSYNPIPGSYTGCRPIEVGERI